MNAARTKRPRAHGGRAMRARYVGHMGASAVFVVGSLADLEADVTNGHLPGRLHNATGPGLYAWRGRMTLAYLGALADCARELLKLHGSLGAVCTPRLAARLRRALGADVERREWDALDVERAVG